MGEVLQAGDEVADGAVAVGPADQFTQTVRGGLNWVGHDINLEEREGRKFLQVNVYGFDANRVYWYLYAIFTIFTFCHF